VLLDWVLSAQKLKQVQCQPLEGRGITYTVAQAGWLKPRPCTHSRHPCCRHTYICIIWVLQFCTGLNCTPEPENMHQKLMTFWGGGAVILSASNPWSTEYFQVNRVTYPDESTAMASLCTTFETRQTVCTEHSITRMYWSCSC